MQNLTEGSCPYALDRFLALVLHSRQHLPVLTLANSLGTGFDERPGVDPERRKKRSL